MRFVAIRWARAVPAVRAEIGADLMRVHRQFPAICDAGALYQAAAAGRDVDHDPMPKPGATGRCVRVVHHQCKILVPAGGFFQLISGDRFSPVQSKPLNENFCAMVVFDIGAAGSEALRVSV